VFAASEPTKTTRLTCNRQCGNNHGTAVDTFSQILSGLAFLAFSVCLAVIVCRLGRIANACEQMARNPGRQAAPNGVESQTGMQPAHTARKQRRDKWVALEAKLARGYGQEGETAAQEIRKYVWYMDVVDDLHTLVELRHVLVESESIPNRAEHTLRQVEAVKKSISLLEEALMNKQFNPQDYPTAAKLTAAYETIKSEMREIEKKYGSAIGVR